VTVSFAVVEVGQLVQVVWVSLATAIVVTGIFAFVVRETARSAEARRARRGGASALHAGLAVVCLVAFAAIVVIGVAVMLNK
jgi:hypothetical protein